MGNVGLSEFYFNAENQKYPMAFTFLTLREAYVDIANVSTAGLSLEEVSKAHLYRLSRFNVNE